MLAVPRPPPNPMDTSRRDVRTSDRPSARYAIPAAEQLPPSVLKSRSGGLSYSEHEQLRQRKTPHGTVYERDCQSVDKHVQVPASKHVLLSTSPSYTRNKPGYQWSLPPPQFHNNLYTMQSLLDQSTAAMPFNSNTYPPAWDFPGGMDSLLDQSQPLPTQRYYLEPGSRVPTVLPATLQTYFRPTASAGQEHYGPYWPDGTFNPYRPASIRDNRFYAPRLQQYANQQAQSVPLPTHTLRKPGKFPSGFQPHQELHMGRYPQHAVDLNYQPSYTELSIRPTQPNNYDIVHPYQESFQAPIYPPFQYPVELDIDRSLYPNAEAESIAFRDKTFSWAHRIYSELLVLHHKYTRESPQSSAAVGMTKPMIKVNIFPKPPKRTGSHFSDDVSTSSMPVSAIQSLRYASDSTLNEIPSRPQTAIHSPHRRASASGRQPASNGLNMGAPPYGPLPFKQDFRRTSDPTVPQAKGFDRGSSIRQTASFALMTMEALCDQAPVPWVDGMLLVGCLAYGLSNYDKALKWYQAILAQDRQHVEAMSNLAATLFALGRKDEALNYWNAVVQLRPSYFEAVEHLIGLLCSSRRAKEAVDLIEFVESKLKIPPENSAAYGDLLSDGDSDAKSNDSNLTASTLPSIDSAQYDYDPELVDFRTKEPSSAGFGSSGYSIPGSENGRMLALLHAKGNMLYALGRNSDAADAFENAVLIATGQRGPGIRGLIRKILLACLRGLVDGFELQAKMQSKDPVLLAPNQAEATARNMFPPTGQLPGLEWITQTIPSKAAVSTTSNSLLSLAKIYQDAMSTATEVGSLRTTSTRDVLALYYLSLSLQRSPSTANNVGILLAGVQHSAFAPRSPDHASASNLPGVVPGSGISLALLYYNYGLNLDSKHAHLYTNLGSLLKDIGQLNAAIKMYENAVSCDPNFDIALANLANAVKDQGRVADAIGYYKRAVNANTNFAEAVCGLATALNSVCDWKGRGGVFADGGARDRVHVNEAGLPHEASRNYGWMNRVVEIVDNQLKEGESWGNATLTPSVVQSLCQQLTAHVASTGTHVQLNSHLTASLKSWAGKSWEGSRIVRLVERAIRRIGWQWYQDRYKEGKEHPQQRYARPQLPAALSSPSAPTVLPFHTFTTPLSAKAVRQISQRNALRISVSTLRSAWLPTAVFPPPSPPRPHLNVGYVSSDFNNHPLAHLMQSIFGYHDPQSVRAFCYATTASDGSIHRAQIAREAPVFRDTSTWSVERLVKQIVKDNIHILINLNGYTRGARNEVFAARPAPIHMSFMGFAGTLGAEWCDYVFADQISVPLSTLSPWRRNVDLEDKLGPDALVEDAEDWVYSENIIFARDTFFCVDHKQSAPDAKADLDTASKPQDEKDSLWRQEQHRRWKLRKELFPQLSDEAVILGNFNQLYKIDPSTFRMYLRILAAVPNAILWLLRFPDLGEQHLRTFAEEWAGSSIASRIVFTDVASKGMHITRASVVDLFLDTPECNAHTTAADVVWSGTPVITWGRWSYKMCSRMAGSILSSAMPDTEEGRKAQKELTVNVPLPGEKVNKEVEKELSGDKGEREYIEKAVRLASGLKYDTGKCFSSSRKSGSVVSPRERTEEGEIREPGYARGRLMEIRRMLWEGRWDSRLFDTKRWVKDLERAYWISWRKWEKGEGGDIWL